MDYLYRKQSKGKHYCYFRFPKRFKVQPVALPVDETSLAFRRAYNECVGVLRKIEADAGAPLKAKPERPARNRFAGSTVAHAVEVYKTTPQYSVLKPNTKELYSRLLDVMKRHIGDAALHDLDRDAVEIYVDAIHQQHGAAVADLHTTLIKSLWRCVRADETFGIRRLPNPALEIARRYKLTTARMHRVWSEEAQDRFMEAAPETLQLAVDLLRFSAQRGGDAVRLRWCDFDGRGIFVTQEKPHAQVTIPSRTTT